jgi:hypothetical protein
VKKLKRPDRYALTRDLQGSIALGMPWTLETALTRQRLDWPSFIVCELVPVALPRKAKARKGGKK